MVEWVKDVARAKDTAPAATNGKSVTKSLESQKKEETTSSNKPALKKKINSE